MSRIRNAKINDEHKDRLFKLIFREKEDLLQLYNAINDTDYDNPDDIEVNTMEDVVYIGMKNDVSFLIKDVLNLYEHQSTFSPNLPLRGVFYFSRLYEKMIGNKRSLYSSRLIRLPYPQFIVFYNGTKEEPERQILELNAAFPDECNKNDAALQCRAVVLNINLGYNSSIMKKCEKLKEYAQFIAVVRDYLAGGYVIEEAINLAVDACIEQGILEQILRNNRGEVCAMILTEYDEQAHMEDERETGREEGRKEGEVRLAKLLQLLIDAGRDEDVSRAISDAKHREQLFQEYKL